MGPRRWSRPRRSCLRRVLVSPRKTFVQKRRCHLWQLYKSRAALAIERSLQLGDVTVANGLVRLDDGAQRLELVLCKVDLTRVKVLDQVLLALGARDRDELLCLVQDPGERELAGLAALLACDLLELLDDLEVALKVLLGKAREHAVATRIAVALEVLKGAEAAREEALAKWRKRKDLDVELLAELEHTVLLEIKAERRILALNKVNLGHLGGAAQCVCGALANADELDLTRLAHLVHLGDDLLDRRLLGDAVDNPSIRRGAKTLDRLVDGAPEVVHVATQERHVLEREAKLGDEEDALAHARLLEYLGDQAFIVALAVDVCRVPQGAADLD